MFEKIIIDILIILGSILMLLLILSLIQVMITLRNINRAISKIRALIDSVDTNYIKIRKILSKLFKY